MECPSMYINNKVDALVPFGKAIILITRLFGEDLKLSVLWLLINKYLCFLRSQVKYPLLLNKCLLTFLFSTENPQAEPVWRMLHTSHPTLLLQHQQWGAPPWGEPSLSLRLQVSQRWDLHWELAAGYPPRGVWGWGTARLPWGVVALQEDKNLKQRKDIEVCSDIEYFSACYEWGGALQVTLRGVALQEDKNLKQRKDIEVCSDIEYFSACYEWGGALQVTLRGVAPTGG